MERIALNRNEKKVLRMLSNGQDNLLTEYDISDVYSLEVKGLVQAAHIESGGIEAVRLTRKGRGYIHSNPKLHNPINWGKIAIIAAILYVLVSFLALFITCQTLSRKLWESL